MQTLLAALPVLVACGLLAARASALRAALAAFAVAVVVAVFAFPVAPGRVWPEVRTLGPTMVEVAAILLGGVLLNELLSASGAQRRLAEWLEDRCRDPARAVLLVVLGVTPFAESVTGFGIGVVVAIPLLRHLGLRPLRAAVAGLLGLVIVPWGALAPGTLVAAQLGGVGFDALGVRSAVLSAIVFPVAGAAALLVTCGRSRTAAALPDLLIMAAALWAGVWGVNVVLGTPLAGALGSLVAIGAGLILARIGTRVRLRPDREVGRALLPYGVLVGGLLVARLIAIVPLHGHGGPITSPALWLLVTCACTPALLHMAPGGRREPLRRALRRWWPVGTSTVVFLALGGVLGVTGMGAALATAATRLGAGYLLLVPFVGGLGGFVAGSNTGANALFAASQAAAAHQLGAATTQVLATQNVAASLATMASPPRVALAAGLAAEPVAAQVRSTAGAGVRANGDEAPADAYAGGEEPPGTPAVLLRVLATVVLVLVLLGITCLLTT